MASPQQLMIMRNECERSLRMAKEALENDLYDKALALYQNVIPKAEELFRISNTEADRDLLVRVYNTAATFYRDNYNYNKQTNMSHQAFTLYEKIVFLYNENIGLPGSEDHIKHLRNMLESYMQILHLSLASKMYHIYKEYVKPAYKRAKELIKYNDVYESEQYLILIDVFNGDYYRFKSQYYFAYFCYYVGMRRLRKIFNDYPQDGIKNDLIMIYTSLYEISLIKNWKRLKNKWQNIIYDLKGEK